jgi:hypothetical protein
VDFSKKQPILPPTGRAQPVRQSFNDFEVRGESLQAKPLMPTASVAQVQFKVVSYGGHKQADSQTQNKSLQGTAANSLINLNSNERDLAVNRNINLNELHELLGN